MARPTTNPSSRAPRVPGTSAPREADGAAAVAQGAAAAEPPAHAATAAARGLGTASALGMAPRPSMLEGPTREEMIRTHAYDRYERNGCVDGRDLDDWLAAEAEVGALLGDSGIADN